MMRGALAPLIFACSFAVSNVAYAADENGKFAIKGGGLQTCVKFVEAMDAGSQDVALYGGWIEGFITAQNQQNDDTFDITPWQTTNTLLSLTKAVCEQANEGARFVDGFAGVYRLLFPSRLRTESEPLGLSNGEARSVAYREILKRVQIALRDQGYDIPDEDGNFDQAAIGQLIEYQRSKGLTASGLPDQPTLYSLFFKK